MLLGQIKTTIDEKNRFTIPSKFRNDFSDNKIIVSIGFEGCLTIRSIVEFTSWKDKILQQSEGIKEARTLARQIFANSEELTIDNKGRINIPITLLQIADIKNQVVAIGLINKLELWNENKWEKFDLENKNKLEDLLTKLKEF